MTDGLRFAVVGAGRFAADFHLPGLMARDDIVVTALCGRERARVEPVAARFSIPAVYADWREMIARHPLDGIVISTPNDLHEPIALAALDAGLHVICDKPLALNAAQARAMLDRAVARGRQHLTMFNYRAIPAARYLKELVEQGYLGQVYHLTAVYYHSSLLDPARPFSWRMSAAQAGTGVLGDLGAHVIDFARWWMGDFARVAGSLVTFTKERPHPTQGQAPVQVDDAAAFVAEMQNGAQTLFHVTKMAAGRGNYIHCEAYGSEGALIFDAEPDRRDNWIGSLRGAQRGADEFVPLEIPARLTAGFETPDVMRSHVSAFRVMTDPFFAAIHAGSRAPVPSSFVDGLAAQEVVDAIARSAESRQWVVVSGQ